MQQQLRLVEFLLRELPAGFGFSPHYTTKAAS
jgi:hypothetical protein